jgi:hypothetical protein
MKKIAIIGKGSASAIAALTIFKHTQGAHNYKIDCIYDPLIPITDVGESASSWIPNLLKVVLDFNLLDEYIDSKIDATIKQGKRIFYKNICGNDFTVSKLQSGIHFNSAKFSSFVIESMEEKFHNFNVIEDNVKSISQSDSCVTITCANNIYTYDYIIDATGTPSKEEFEADLYEFPKYEFVNSVVIYPEPKTYNEPFTSMIGHDNGWMFGIPLRHRKAWGYLYNNEFLTKETAIENFSKLNDIDTDKLRCFSWKQYYKKDAMDNRILFLGNKLYLFEPTHAMALHYYMNLSRSFIDLLEKDESTKGINYILNFMHNESMQQMRDMIALHYVNPKCNNSEFWKVTSSRALESLRDSSYFKNWLNYCLGIKFKVTPYFTQDIVNMTEYINGYGIDLSQLRDKINNGN